MMMDIGGGRHVLGIIKSRVSKHRNVTFSYSEEKDVDIKKWGRTFLFLPIRLARSEVVVAYWSDTRRLAPDKRRPRVLFPRSPFPAAKETVMEATRHFRHSRKSTAVPLGLAPKRPGPSMSSV